MNYLKEIEKGSRKYRKKAGEGLKLAGKFSPVRKNYGKRIGGKKGGY